MPSEFGMNAPLEQPGRANPLTITGSHAVRGLEASVRRRDAVLAAICYASSRFLTTADWERDVQAVLGRLGSATEVSRAYLFESITDERGEMRACMRQEWAAPGLKLYMGNSELQNLPLANSGFARLDVLARGEPVHGAVRSFPPSEQELFARHGIRSIAVMPVFAGSEWWGYLAFSDDATEREWPPALLEVLQAAAAVIGAALFRRRSEQELRESEERFRRLTEAAAEGILIQEQGVALEANQALSRMFGYEIDEIIGRNVLDLLPAPESREVVARHMLAGSEERYEAVGRRKDGSLFIGEIAAHNTSYRGRPVRVATIQDITERKQAEESARRLIEEKAARAAAEEAGRRAQFLSEASRVLGASFDYHTTLASLARLAVPTLADHCVIDVMGRDGLVERVAVAHTDPAKEALLREAARFVCGGTPPSYHLCRTLVGGEVVLVEHVTSADFAVIHEEHRRIVERLQPRSLLAVPLRASERIIGVLALYTSESERHFGAEDLGLSEELARRASLAIENARLFHEAREATTARDEMLSVVAHDLRNPLGTIRMAASLMLETLPGAERSAERNQAEMIRRASDRMNRLIQDLLDVRRVESGRLTVETRQISVAALIREAVEMLRPLATASSLELRAEMPDTLPMAVADPSRVQQVLSNLVGNAIKFTPAGGRIQVRAQHLAREISLAVIDTGPGIPPDQLPHIFSRFWQAKPTDRRGIGLGLAIAKGIVEAHGGRIWVESRVGEGSSFVFTLPAAV